MLRKVEKCGSCSGGTQITTITNQHIYPLSQVHNFCAILMAEPDEPDKYKYNLEIPDVGQRSILHMFAERGLTQCAETFLDMPEVRAKVLMLISV